MLIKRINRYVKATCANCNEWTSIIGELYGWICSFILPYDGEMLRINIFYVNISSLNFDSSLSYGMLMGPKEPVEQGVVFYLTPPATSRSLNQNSSRV